MNRKPSSFFRIDEQVFFTMGALCVLALIVMAFRMGTHTPCSPVKIEIKSTDLTERSLIRFNAASTNGKTWAWNFGDGTLKEEESAFANHEYRQPGKYTVSVMVNGECSDIQTVMIDAAPVVVSANLRPMIICSVIDTAYINEPVSFNDASILAKQWAWSFGESGKVDDTSKNAIYTFHYTGKKKIRLKINDQPDLIDERELLVLDRAAEKKRAEKQVAETQRRAAPIFPVLPPKPGTEPITVPKEEPKKEEVKVKAPAVTNEQLEALIRGVCDETKTAADFYPYMGGSKTIQVVYNSDLMTLDQMCAQLKGMKSKKIKSLKITPMINESNNALNSISVTLKKKSLFGL